MDGIRCLDAGAGACPCVLAGGGCPVCPPLSGGDCDCDWGGVCILSSVKSARRTARRPTLSTRVLSVWEAGGDCALVAVEWPAALIPRPCSYCIVATADGAAAAPVLGISDCGGGLVILMQGQLPLPGDRLAVRGPFPPNGPG